MPAWRPSIQAKDDSMNRKCYSLGGICYSKFYISLELHRCTWFFSIGKTYVGTRTGLITGFGFGSIMAHVRR